MKKLLGLIGFTLLFCSFSFANDFSTTQIKAIKTFEAKVMLLSMKNEKLPEILGPKLKKLISSAKNESTKILAREIYKNLGFIYTRTDAEDYAIQDCKKSTASQSGDSQIECEDTSTFIPNSPTFLNVTNIDDAKFFAEMTEKMGMTEFVTNRMKDAQSAVRDTVRKGHLFNILTSTTQYYGDNGMYPSFTGFVSADKLEETLIPEYISEIPLNPSGGEYYYYKSLSKNGNEDMGMILTAHMELSKNCNFIAKDISDLETKIKGKSHDEIIKMFITDSSKIGIQKCFYVLVK